MTCLLLLSKAIYLDLGSLVVDLFVMAGMGDNLEQSSIQINFFSALPSCGRVPCTWLHTVHGLPSFGPSKDHSHRQRWMLSMDDFELLNICQPMVTWGMG